MIINVIQLGRVPYGLGLKIQAELVAARKAGQISDTLVLLEHEPVITLGRNARADNIIVGRRQLEERGVEVFECDRGGDVTFHGPGQLVGYPIFNLFGYSPRIGAVDFMRKIEEALIRTCAICPTLTHSERTSCARASGQARGGRARGRAAGKRSLSRA